MKSSESMVIAQLWTCMAMKTTGLLIVAICPRMIARGEGVTVATDSIQGTPVLSAVASNRGVHKMLGY